LQGRSAVGTFFVIAGIGLAAGGYLVGGLASGVLVMIGLIWAAVGIGVVLMYRSWGARLQQDRRLFETGRRAPGVIESVQTTGMVVNNINSQIVITVRVQPAGEPEFTVQPKMLVPFNAIPRTGDTIEVAYDPNDHNRVAFNTDWRMDTAGGRALITQPAAQAAAAPAAGGEDEVLEQLERLQKLRDAGTLSESEFEVQKAKILARSS
jgi:hypothetical protein